jgi:ribosome-binding factor A
MTRRMDKIPSQRQLRVGEMLRHALAEILERGDLRDPGLKDVVVSVTEVRASPDLRNATAFIIPLGGHGETEVIEALERAQPFIRRAVAKKVQLRSAPKFSFIEDASFKEARRIDRLLQDPHVAQDLAAPQQDGDGRKSVVDLDSGRGA